MWRPSTRLGFPDNRGNQTQRKGLKKQLLPVYYSPATKDTPDAVFRTAAEISARLSFLGNIRQPMAINILGRMLVQQGYLPIKLPGGKRGYFVLEHTNTQADIQNILKELEE